MSHSTYRWVLIQGILAIIFSTEVNGQRIYDTQFLARNMGLEGLVKGESREELEGLPPILNRLEEKYGLDSTNYSWLCLQVFRVLALVHNNGHEVAAAAARQYLETPPARQNNFATRALLALEANSLDLTPGGGLGARGTHVLLRGLELAREAEDAQMEFDMSLLMARAFIRYRRRDLAWEWLARAREILPTIEDPLNCHLYYVLAGDAANPEKWAGNGQLIWESVSEETQARAWIDRSIECGEQAFAEGHYLSADLGLSFHIRSSYWKEPWEEAYYYKQVLPYYRKGSKIQLAEGHAEMGRIYISLGKMDSALIFLDSSRVILEDFKEDLVNVRRCTHFFATYYQTLGGHQDSVYKYQMLYYKAKAEGTEARAVAEIQVYKGRFQEARQKLTILEQEAVIDARDERNRYLTFSLGSLGLISILVLLALLRIRQRNKVIHLRNVEVREKNERIKGIVDQLEQSLAIKTLLIQEVNHRVKNNLQMINDFVNIQAQFVEDKETLVFASGIQRRIRAVGLVHEMILEKSLQSALGFEKYALQLIGELESLHFRGEAFECHCDIEPVQLSMSTNMCLGIILNELISNSMKYAIKDGKPLNIWVELKQEGTEFSFSYRDSGDGLPQHAFSGQNSGGGIGLILVDAMARQLEGKLDYLEPSAEFRIKFKDIPLES